ncbi:keratinocyte-associated protein 3-like isoform X2 [Cyprinus carpio]|uniref:Keratinocyte-associated protein 3-like isoform X2 n=1 Tax=Cyprinus carpio TaxID=7962 RepID=A0A9Q9XGM1_CYPCA|nr:keratinocyte-associated protein 3-like isoform X2 [Cyprinus carpio]
MGNSGGCCGNLEEQKGLMKMGLCMVLVGHVNFLLGALVHGVVLRHFSLQRGQAMESAISNIIALATGLLGVIIGILTIVLSKNRKNRGLTWSLFVSSAVAVLVAAASVIGLMVSLVKTIIHGDKRLLAYCGYSDGRSHLTIANDCPFDPTRIFMKTQRTAGPRYSPQPRRCQGDEERKLSVIRPPERHRPPLRSVSPGQYSQHPSAPPFSRAALERSSIWI